MVTVAQRLLEADLESAEFKIGVAKGHWGLVKDVCETDWPHVWIWVRAAPRPQSPDRFIVRWALDNYKSTSPTGGFWDVASQNFLPKTNWPKGKPGSLVAMVFKVDGWAAPGTGFYHPYDRLARHGHEEWPAKHPQRIWTEKNSITDFVILVHRWLNCEDYLGC